MFDPSVRAVRAVAVLLGVAVVFVPTLGFDAIAGTGPSTLGACGDEATRIHRIQGRGRSSPLAGEVGVVVEAVVVGTFPGAPDGLGGFFVQEEDGDVDGDPLTSEGLFVYAPDLDATFGLQVGDVVRLRGQVQEFFGKTEIVAVDALAVCASDAVATAAEVVLPVPEIEAGQPEYWERWEGMGVGFAEPLWVIDQFATGRFGEVELAATERLWQPTQHVAPGPDAIAWQQRDERYRILLDDGESRVSPEPWPYLAVEPGGTLRLGDRVSEVAGVLDFAYGRFRIQPNDAPRLEARGVVPLPPSVSGALRIVGWNVENLFNGDGVGGGFPTRGAGSLPEYERQRAKVVATLAALDPDVIALVELENDGIGEGSVLRDLTDALRADEPGLDYRPIDPGEPLGGHAIAVGILYRADVVSALGAASVLDERTWASFDSSRNRPSLAQTFRHLASGRAFTVVVNHFKSKGSSCASSGDPDLGDGQGNCNGTRRNAAIALAEWLASDPTASGGAPVLIVGDFNAYPLEDPVVELMNAGFVDLLAAFDGPDAYTFVFDGRSGRLDHALISPDGLVDVRGAAVWNVNSDESEALDYRDGNPVGLYHADPRRASDHDPVIVGLFARAVPEPTASTQALTAVGVLSGLRRARRRRRSKHPDARFRFVGRPDQTASLD